MLTIHEVDYHQSQRTQVLGVGHRGMVCLANIAPAWRYLVRRFPSSFHQESSSISERKEQRCLKRKYHTGAPGAPGEERKAVMSHAYGLIQGLQQCGTGVGGDTIP